MSKWFKFYGQDWMTDPKVIRLTPEQRLCFVTLMCLASASRHDDYRITGLTPEVLLSISHITPDPYNDTGQWEKNLKTLDVFNDNEMITLHDNGDIVIKRFKERQESQLTGYERIKKYREKQKQDKNIEQINTTTKPKKDSKVINDNKMITVEKRRVEKKREDKKRIYDNTCDADASSEGEIIHPTDGAVGEEPNGAIINSLIGEFQPINPSYTRIYKNKTQRAAIDRMMKQYGTEQLRGIIQFLQKTNGKRFAPTITTPIQLEERMGALVAFCEKIKDTSLTKPAKEIIGL